MIVDNQYYQYISLGMATISFLPQFYHSYYSKSMKDLCALTYIFISISSILWSYYMYEKQLYYHAALTLFVTMNSTALIVLKFYLYIKRIRQHYNSFDGPQSAPIPVQLAQA